VLSLLWLPVVGPIAGLLARALVPGGDSMSLPTTGSRRAAGRCPTTAVPERVSDQRAVAAAGRGGPP
jgi:hypothetical protein